MLSRRLLGNRVSQDQHQEPDKIFAVHDLPSPSESSPDAKLSSHILHTGAVEAFAARTEEEPSEKHVAPVRGEGQRKIESDTSCITSE